MSLHSFRMVARTVEKLIKMIWLISCVMFYIYKYFTKN